MSAAAWVWIGLNFVYLVLVAIVDGRQRVRPWSFKGELVTVIGTAALLWWGGFFR